MNNNLVQRSEEWIEFRKNKIGSSDIAAICGLSPYKSIKDVWLEKTGKKPADPINSFMQWGNDHEEEARLCYISHSGNVVEPAVIISEKEDFAIASLDGITLDGSLLVEIKCPHNSDLLEKTKNEKIPIYYMAQIQWQLLVSKAKRADFFVWTKSANVVQEILPDPIMQQMLLEGARKFWNMVINDIEPQDTEAFIEIDTPEFIIASENWKIASENLRKAEEEEKKWRAALLEETDGGSCLGNGIKITYVKSQGCINYEAVCKEYGIEKESLDKFRKPPKSFIRVSMIK